MRKILITAMLAAALSLGCAQRAKWSLTEPQTTADDSRPLTADPRERDPSLYWDAVHQSSFYLIDQSLDLPRQYRKLTGRMHEAVNADVFGRVPNSSWFTNRHGETRLSREELRRGPDRIEGPETGGPWTITRAKTEGVTPGFFIKDSRGETFVLKFDPAAHPELATGAEMVCTKLFYAFGYNVPENYLITFDPAILTIRDGLEFKDAKGKSHQFTSDVLANVLTKVAKRPDGTIRAIASRLLPGKPVGPFSYKGRRKDDPNDLIPHEHRRELRGLKVFAQLVNHFDTKDHNTLDIVVEENMARYIRHYLIDFGSTLGSDGDEPKAVYKGYAYVLDLEQALVSLFTLGLRRWSWEYADTAGIPAAVGYFESDLFDPPGWKPLHGNPAFDNMTYSDALWACRILAAFTEDDLRVCVETAEYSDPAASEYLVKTLWQRRAKILDYYYQKISPLDDFEIIDDGTTVQLAFVDDLTALESAGAYNIEFKHNGQRVASFAGLTANWVTLDSATRSGMAALSAIAGSDRERVFLSRIVPHRGQNRGPAVSAFFYFDGNPQNTRLVGVEHHN